MSSSLAGFTSRYANALFQLADEQGRVDAVAGDLRAILDLIGSSEDFARFVSSPAISRDDQAAAVNAILEKAGADALVQKFIGVVAENGRLFSLISFLPISPHVVVKFQQKSFPQPRLTQISKMRSKRLSPRSRAVTKFLFLCGSIRR